MDCSTCYCPCCSKSAANNSSSASSSSNSNSGVQYVNFADCEGFRTSIQRDMAHIKVTDYAQTELIEELQDRTKELQNRVQELQKMVTSAHRAIGALLSFVTYSTYDRASLVSSSSANSYRFDLELTRDINQKFTPFDIYERYLTGDYKNDPVNHGFQLDEDIKAPRNVKPAEMVDYLPPKDPPETDRFDERIKVKEMFIGIGSGRGAAQSDLSEIYHMLNTSDREYAIKILKQMWTQGVLNLTASDDSLTSDDSTE